MLTARTGPHTGSCSGFYVPDPRGRHVWFFYGFFFVRIDDETCGCMDGGMNGWRDGWVNEWVVACMNGWTDD